MFGRQIARGSRFAPVAILLGVVLAMTATTATAGRGGRHEDHHRGRKGRSACRQSADKMRSSCIAEVFEEYKATEAMCINLGDPDEREECLASASEARKEDKRSCSEQRDARRDVCELLGEDLYDPEALLDAQNFVEEPDDSNPYFNLAPGHTWVLRAGLPPDFEETVVVTVTDEVREVLGVNCRRVVDIVLEEEDGEYSAVEVTDDFYALALNGDVHYCGEVARNFEDGRLANLDGSFEAGVDLAKSGILIEAAPATGDAHRQEYLLGEAEDVIQYLAGAGEETSVGEGEGGENPNGGGAFSCAPARCVKTQEFIPPEPDAGEYKYFLAGTGFVLGVALEDGEPTGERDELLCSGDSLEVLEDPACGIEAEALPGLKELLCELSPVAFCD